MTEVILLDKVVDDDPLFRYADHQILQHAHLHQLAKGVEFMGYSLIVEVCVSWRLP